MPCTGECRSIDKAMGLDARPLGCVSPRYRLRLAGPARSTVLAIRASTPDAILLRCGIRLIGTVLRLVEAADDYIKVAGRNPAYSDAGPMRHFMAAARTERNPAAGNPGGSADVVVNVFLRHANYYPARSDELVWLSPLSRDTGAVMIGDPSLLAEIEGAMASRSASGRGDTLRKVTDLFVGGAAKFNDQQVALFDDVIGQLADSTDTPAKAELSQRLSSVDNAPVNTVHRLAADDAIDVAQPILANSSRLDETKLADIAATKGRRHMLAIAGRRQLGERVTDALLKRGDQQVVRTVATNGGAKVSEKGYEKLVDLATSDPHLAESIVARQDIPHRHFRTLIALAPEPVQQRLASTNPRLAERIRQAIAEADEEKAQAVHHDYTHAKETVAVMAKAQTLGDDVVFEFAKNGQFEEAVVALAVLTGMTIDPASRLLTSEPTNTMLIVARAASLTWPTVKALIVLRNAPHLVAPQDLEDARMSFIRLNPETAKQGLKFYKLRAAAPS